MSGAAKVERTSEVGDPSADRTGDVNLKPVMAMYAERLKDAKKCADKLKSYFKEHAPAATRLK